MLRKLIVGVVVSLTAILGSASMAAASEWVIFDRAGSHCGTGTVNDGIDATYIVIVNACIA